jgi:hypothetical protein
VCALRDNCENVVHVYLSNALVEPFALSKKTYSLVCLTGSCLQGLEVATPGGAGHALLFADHAVVLKGIKVWICNLAIDISVATQGH